MILLADNDVLRKLAACDLLDETVAVLGASYAEVYVLQSLWYRFSLKEEAKGRRKLGDVVYTRLRDFLMKVRVLDQAPPAIEIQLFAEVDDIDGGEAILFASTAFYPQCVLATGDKRSLTALAALSTATAVVARLTERVLCFEQILLRLCDQLGFEVVRAKLAAVGEFDVATGIIFGMGCSRPEAQVRQALHSYIEDLRGRTGRLLAT